MNKIKIYGSAKKYSSLSIVALGGGTGLSTMLRGLKKYSQNITAIVSVADDGGGSGVLRRENHMLPPGDIRNCILALADAEPIMQELFNYRFNEGRLSGQSFGNLFLAAMNGISDNFEEAVKRVSDVLAVVGRVLPVTNESVSLNAVLDSGKTIMGESKIGEIDTFSYSIDRVFLTPSSPKPAGDIIAAIEDADIILLGPGSLFTSVIPNLLVDGVTEAIFHSKAPTIYVCNIMTQAGETIGYSAYEHVNAIEAHSKKGIIDAVIVNTSDIPMDVLTRYEQEGADRVIVDKHAFENNGIRLTCENIASFKEGNVRHDYEKLAKLINELALDMVETRII